MAGVRRRSLAAGLLLSPLPLLLLVLLRSPSALAPPPRPRSGRPDLLGSLFEGRYDYERDADNDGLCYLESEAWRRYTKGLHLPHTITVDRAGRHVAQLKREGCDRPSSREDDIAAWRLVIQAWTSDLRAEWLKKARRKPLNLTSENIWRYNFGLPFLKREDEHEQEMQGQQKAPVSSRRGPRRRDWEAENRRRDVNRYDYLNDEEHHFNAADSDEDGGGRSDGDPNPYDSLWTTALEESPSKDALDLDQETHEHGEGPVSRRLYARAICEAMELPDVKGDPERWLEEAFADISRLGNRLEPDIDKFFHQFVRYEGGGIVTGDFRPPPRYLRVRRSAPSHLRRLREEEICERAIDRYGLYRYGRRWPRERLHMRIRMLMRDAHFHRAYLKSRNWTAVFAGSEGTRHRPPRLRVLVDHTLTRPPGEAPCPPPGLLPLPSSSSPCQLCLLPSGHILYTDGQRHVLRVLVDDNGDGDGRGTRGRVVDRLAAGSPEGLGGHCDGAGTRARFLEPMGVAADAATGTVLVADSGNNRIRRVSPDGTVTTVAGGEEPEGSPAAVGSPEEARYPAPTHADGCGTEARFFNPRSIAVDGRTGVVYVADTGNLSIRRIRFVRGRALVDTLDLPRYPRNETVAPVSVDVLDDGRIVAGWNDNRIRVISPDGKAVRMLAGSGFPRDLDGAGAFASFSEIAGIHVVRGDGHLVVTDRASAKVRRVDLSTGETTTLLGTGLHTHEHGAAEGREQRSLSYPLSAVVDVAGRRQAEGSLQAQLGGQAPRAARVIVADTLNARVVAADYPAVQQAALGRV